MRVNRDSATGVVLAVALSIVLAGVLGAAAVGAQEEPTPEDSPTDQRTITVLGQGSAEAPPDRAVLVVAVVAEGEDPATVRDDLAAGADALRGSLANASVDAERIETVEYRIAEPDRFPSEEPGAEEEPAYRGVHAFEVTLDDVDRTGPVVDAVADAGAEVRVVSFTLSEERRDELREQGLTGAMDDARQQADVLASAGDLRVTGVRSVDATNRRFEPFTEDVAGADAARTTFEPGDVAVSVEVRVTYDAAAEGAADSADSTDATETGSATETTEPTPTDANATDANATEPTPTDAAS